MFSRKKTRAKTRRKLVEGSDDGVYDVGCTLKATHGDMHVCPCPKGGQDPDSCAPGQQEKRRSSMFALREQNSCDDDVECQWLCSLGQRELCNAQDKNKYKKIEDKEAKQEIKFDNKLVAPFYKNPMKKTEQMWGIQAAEKRWNMNEQQGKVRLPSVHKVLYKFV